MRVGPVRIVCPRDLSLPIAEKLNTHGKSIAWTQYPFPWAKDLVFTESRVDHPKDLEHLTTLVQGLINQGMTAGLMSVEPIKALFFDMDATVIVEESLVEIAAERGLSAEIHRITDLAMDGKLDFKEALLQRIEMLKGTPRDLVEKVGQRLTLQPGIISLVRRARRENIKCFMVSGGFTILAAPLGKTVGLDGVHANVLGFDHDTLNGKIEGPIIDGLGKKQFLELTCQNLRISLDETIAIGDGANDVPMVQAARFGSGFQPKQALRSSIHFQNQQGDHRLLEYFLFGSLENH